MPRRRTAKEDRAAAWAAADDERGTPAPPRASGSASRIDAAYSALFLQLDARIQRDKERAKAARWTVYGAGKLLGRREWTYRRERLLTHVPRAPAAPPMVVEFAAHGSDWSYTTRTIFVMPCGAQHEDVLAVVEYDHSCSDERCCHRDAAHGVSCTAERAIRNAVRNAARLDRRCSQQRVVTMAAEFEALVLEACTHGRWRAS